MNLQRVFMTFLWLSPDTRKALNVGDCLSKQLFIRLQKARTFHWVGHLSSGAPGSVVCVDGQGGLVVQPSSSAAFLLCSSSTDHLLVAERVLLALREACLIVWVILDTSWASIPGWSRSPVPRSRGRCTRPCNRAASRWSGCSQPSGRFCLPPSLSDSRTPLSLQVHICRPTIHCG